MLFYPKTNKTRTTHIFIFCKNKNKKKQNINSHFSLYSHFPHSHTLFTKLSLPHPQKKQKKTKQFIYDTRISLSLHISHTPTHFTIHHSLFSR